jgi:hypothetical protein
VVKAVLSKLPLWLFPSFPPYGQSSVCVSVIPKSPLAYYSLPPQSLWLQPTSSSWAAPSSPMPLGWACLQPPCKTASVKQQQSAAMRVERWLFTASRPSSRSQRVSFLPHISLNIALRAGIGGLQGTGPYVYVISRGKF